MIPSLSTWASMGYPFVIYRRSLEDGMWYVSIAIHVPPMQ